MTKIYRSTSRGCEPTTMQEMPANCAECSNTFCLLPFIAKNGRIRTNRINEYYDKRHPHCPLFEMRKAGSHERN